MFARAVSVASHYTRPVVLSRRQYDGSLESGLAAFVIINSEGWIMTAAHVFNTALVFQQHQKELAAYEAAGAMKKKGQRQSKVPKRNPEWLTNHSFWWGRDGTQCKNVALSLERDIAVAQLEPFDASWCLEYPKFKDPSAGLLTGTSLCKLGYPFHGFTPSFTEDGQFALPEGALPVPRFPIEGIYTRNVLSGKTNDGKHEIKFIETSSPGLKGQSGGPVFDVEGVVWAIQSRANHLPLGFDPPAPKGGRRTEQFLNVGLGVHPEVLHSFLEEHDVKFEVA